VLDAELTGLGSRKDTMNPTDRNGPGASPRRKFDETYKRHAVELTLHGDRTVKTVAKELGIPAWQLYDWRKLYAPRPGDRGPEPQTLEEAEKEIKRLRSEVIRMREREVVLKKSLGILSETPESGMPRLRR
jgi:transposase-like protein